MMISAKEKNKWGNGDTAAIWGKVTWYGLTDERHKPGGNLEEKHSRQSKHPCKEASWNVPETARRQCGWS